MYSEEEEYTILENSVNFMGLLAESVSLLAFILGPVSSLFVGALMIHPILSPNSEPASVHIFSLVVAWMDVFSMPPVIIF